MVCCYNTMNEGEDVRSERSFNTVQYLLNKQYSPQRRKISEWMVEERQRPNFVLHHRAQEYTVVRVYINSLQSSQVRLYYSKFTPRVKEGTICIVHGYGESSDDYIAMAEYFARNKFVVNMLDLRSFGYSGGLRVNEPIQGLLSDIENLLRRCCEIGLPTYVVSHGFGCLLVLALLEENPRLPLAGVVAMSPLFSFPFFKEASLVGRGVLWLLSSLFSDMIINNMINPTCLTNSPTHIKGCIDGVFNYQFTSIQMVRQYAELSAKVLEEAGRFEYPLLMLYGGKNLIQPKEEVKRFYQLCRSREKHSFIFKNGYHQLFKDEGAEEELFPKILEWLLDDSSNKNQTKWKKTEPFSLQVMPRTPHWVKYLALALIPLLVLVVRRARR